MNSDTQPDQGTLGWFIDAVLLGEMRRMILDCHLYYLGFGSVASGIEFLGACMDTSPINEEGHSRVRFEAAVSGLFAEDYKPYVGRASNHDLYKNLRCGMTHIIRPQGDVAFTCRAESQAEGTPHLQVAAGTNKLVLVSEDFYEDFVAATDKLISNWEKLAMKDLRGPYLEISARP